MLLFLRQRDKHVFQSHQDLKSFQLGLDGSELLDQQSAVVLGVQVAQVLTNSIQTHDCEVSPKS